MGLLGLVIAGFGTYKAVSYIKNKTKFKETTDDKKVENKILNDKVNEENTVYGINKFGYNATEDCVYKRKNGKINVVIIGSSAEKRKQFIDDIKNNKKVRSHNCYAEEYKCNGGLADCIEYRISKWPANNIHQLCVSEERAKFSNWNIIEKDLNNDSADEIANLLKNDVAMAVFMIDDEDNKDKIREIFLKSLVSNLQWEGDTKYSYLDKGHSYDDFIRGPAYIPTGFIFKNNKNNKNYYSTFDKITPIINGMAKDFLSVLRIICDDGRIFYNSKDHNYDIGRGF